MITEIFDLKSEEIWQTKNLSLEIDKEEFEVFPGDFMA